jgi:uncharacterized membrane protein
VLGNRLRAWQLHGGYFFVVMHGGCHLSKGGSQNKFLYASCICIMSGAVLEIQTMLAASSHNMFEHAYSSILYTCVLLALALQSVDVSVFRIHHLAAS